MSPGHISSYLMTSSESSSHLSIHLVHWVKLSVSLNLRSISFIGNGSIFFIIQYWFYVMKEMDYFINILDSLC